MNPALFTCLASTALALSTPSVAAQTLASPPQSGAAGPVRSITYDWATQTWAPNAGLEAASSDVASSDVTVYANTAGITPTTISNFAYTHFPPGCETTSVSGRIPSPSSPGAPAGVTTSNLITAFTFAYYVDPFTAVVDPSVVIEFFQGDACAGGAATSPLATFQLTGIPGSGLNIVTVDLSSAPFSMLSDGDGTWDNDAALDNFTWSFRNTSTSSSLGPVHCKGPQVGPVGNCTYGNPCGPEGATGLGTPDTWYHEEATAGCSGLASGCYWFGPGNFDGYYLTLTRASADEFYCTPKASSAGCLSAISLSGPLPAVSGASDLFVTSTAVQGFKNGLVFASISGPSAIPFSGGTLCVDPPLKRGPVLNSGGTSPVSCDGSYSHLVNDGLIIPFGLDPGPGNTAWYQYWYRDPNNGAGNLGTALSNGLQLAFL